MVGAGAVGTGERMRFAGLPSLSPPEAIATSLRPPPSLSLGAAGRFELLLCDGELKIQTTTTTTIIITHTFQELSGWDSCRLDLQSDQLAVVNLVRCVRATMT